MYSQAHISLFYIYWRVWLLVIRGPEKANLGSLEAFMQCSKKILNSLLQLDANHLVSEVKPLYSRLETIGKTLAQVLAFTFKIDLTISSCNAGGGNSPSLDCAVQEEHGHSKGERRVLFGPNSALLSLVMLVLQQRSKGQSA